MVKIYVDAIRDGRMSIEDVPKRWRKAVEEALNNGTTKNKEEE